MRTRHLFDLISVCNDVAEHFTDVTSQEQMVSRLERLKKNPDDLLADIVLLKSRIDALLDDTLEMNRDVGELTDEENEKEEADPFPDLEDMSDDEVDAFLKSQSEGEGEKANEDDEGDLEEPKT